MNFCQNCRTHTAGLYLCQSCAITLADMLAELPWLIEELDARIQKLDQIGVGTIGRNRRPDEMNVIDFDAAETARKLRRKLVRWVETITEKHSGRRPPALDTVQTKHLAKWLELNVDAITQLDLGIRDHHGHTKGHQLYNDIAQLTGKPTDARGGQLHAAINRHQHNLAGPCPTITSHDHEGEPIICDTMLYADVDETTVTCPECGQDIDVATNRRQTEINRDLMTEARILEVMDDLGEHISRVRFYRWVRELRIRPKGWFNKNHGLLTREDPRRLRGDPAVYSLARARKLRARELQHHQEAKAQ